MGIWRFAKFSRNARTLACVGNRLSSPKVRRHDRAWSPPRADDPDRPRPLHDDPIALSIFAPHCVAARLVVGPDDVRHVGVGSSDTTRWRRAVTGLVRKSMAVTPNPRSPGPRFLRLQASVPGPPQRAPMFRIRRQRLTKPSDQPSRARSSIV